MAKKKEPQEVIKVDNALIQELAEVKWLNNPVIYSQVAGDFSLWQQRILIGILEQMQGRISDSIEGKRNTGDFGPLFSEVEVKDDPNLEMIIDPRSLGVTPDHYDELEDALTKLFNQTMKYPTFDKKGKLKSYVMAHIFSRAEMPAGDIRRTGKLRMVMLKENLIDIFGTTSGYVTHVARIAQICNKKRTPRLYIYLSRYRDIGHKVVPYKDLFEYLGLTDEYYAEGKVIKEVDGKRVYWKEDKKDKTKGKWMTYENPFTKFSKVERNVLVPSQQEMDALCERGEIDFQFEYEPVYDNGRTKGNPSSIIFTINKGPLGEYRDQVLKRSGNERKVIGYLLKHCPDLKSADVVPIVTRVKPEHWTEFADFVYKVIFVRVEQKQPDDVAAYIMALLERWEPVPHQEPIKEQIVLNVPKPKAEVYEQRYIKEWNEVVAAYDGEGKDALMQGVPLGVNELGMLVVEFPQEVFDRVDVCWGVISEAFKKKVGIKHGPGVQKKRK